MTVLQKFKNVVVLSLTMHMIEKCILWFILINQNRICSMFVSFFISSPLFNLTNQHVHVFVDELSNMH